MISCLIGNPSLARQCRRLLIHLSDAIFPPANEIYSKIIIFGKRYNPRYGQHKRGQSPKSEVRSPNPNQEEVMMTVNNSTRTHAERSAGAVSAIGQWNEVNSCRLYRARLDRTCIDLRFVDRLTVFHRRNIHRTHIFGKNGYIECT